MFSIVLCIHYDVVLQKLFDLMKDSSDVPAEKLTKLSKVYSTRV